MGLDQDHTRRPLGPGGRAQILNRHERSWLNGHSSVQSFTDTHHFGRDVDVGQVSVLTHDRQVAVDVDGQRVACQHQDAAQRPDGQTADPQVTSPARFWPHSPLLSFVEELLNLLDSSTDVLHFGS